MAAVDNQGMVQSLNPALAQLLELPISAALGRPLQQLCPELDLQQALQDGAGEGNRVIRLGSHAVVSNLLPILENGERTGLVLTCQNIAAVQRADQRIRSACRPDAFTARYRLETTQRQQQGEPRNATAGQAFRRQPFDHPDHW